MRNERFTLIKHLRRFKTNYQQRFHYYTHKLKRRHGFGIKLGIAVVFLFFFISLLLLPIFIFKPILGWENNQLLQYCGTCGATIGTIFLGVVALRQNHNMYKHDKEMIYPKIKCLLISYNFVAGERKLFVTFRNISNNTASGVYSDMTCLAFENSDDLLYLEASKKNVNVINANETIKFAYYDEILNSGKVKLEMNLNFLDCQGNEHTIFVSCKYDGNEWSYPTNYDLIW